MASSARTLAMGTEFSQDSTLANGSLDTDDDRGTLNSTERSTDLQNGNGLALRSHPL